MTDIDVGPLVPAARAPAALAVTVFLEHTGPWFIGLLAHGSALTGGFIPGCSDIDFKLFLHGDAFDSNGHLPMELALTIHRDLAVIDPSPFQYIQCYPVDAGSSHAWPRGNAAPIPGAYHVVAGRLPIPEATADDLRDEATRALGAIAARHDYAGSLLQHGGGHLERPVRLMCTDVWPALYHRLVLETDDPITIWQLPKDRAIALLAKDSPLGVLARRFHARVSWYYGGNRSIAGALTILSDGAAFLRHAGDGIRESVRPS